MDRIKRFEYYIEKAKDAARKMRRAIEEKRDLEEFLDWWSIAKYCYINAIWCIEREVIQRIAWMVEELKRKVKDSEVQIH